MKVYVLWDQLDEVIEGIFDTEAAARAAWGDKKHRAIEEFELQSAIKDHLKRLLEAGAEVHIMDGHCHYCEGSLLGEIAHKPDCPYVAAKAFVEGLG